MVIRRAPSILRVHTKRSIHCGPRQPATIHLAGHSAGLAAPRSLAAGFASLSTNLGQHRRPGLRFRVPLGLRRLRAFKFFRCRGRPPDNQRYAEDADRDTRQETGDKPEQARHCLPRIDIRLPCSLKGIELRLGKMPARVKSGHGSVFWGNQSRSSRHSHHAGIAIVCSWSKDQGQEQAHTGEEQGKYQSVHSHRYSSLPCLASFWSCESITFCAGRIRSWIGAIRPWLQFLLPRTRLWTEKGSIETWPWSHLRRLQGAPRSGCIQPWGPTLLCQCADAERYT